MSACWVSRSARTLLAALLALTVAAPVPAGARQVREVTITHDDGSVTRRVQVDGRTIAVIESSSAGTDTLRSGHGVSIGFVKHGAGNDDRVSIFSNGEVAAGERVDGDVVALFGSLHVAGHVTGSTVAVFGSVTLDSSAVVQEDAVAIGGRLKDAPGAKVGGDRVRIGLMPLLTLGLPALPVALGGIALAALIAVLFGAAVAALAPTRFRRIAAASVQRPGVSFLLGLASGPMALLAFVLLLVTVIGIPVALLLPLLFVFAGYAGQLASLSAFGCRLIGRRVGEGGAFAPLLAASVALAGVLALGVWFWTMQGTLRTVSVFLVALVGLQLLWFSLVGMGAFLLTLGGSRSREATPPSA
jgi:hypothetical protein